MEAKHSQRCNYIHTYIHTYIPYHTINAYPLYFAHTIYSVSGASNSTESLTTSNGATVVDAYSTIDATAAANALKGAKSVVIVPGYGLAVAKAQFVIADIANVCMYVCSIVIWFSKLYNLKPFSGSEKE